MSLGDQRRLAPVGPACAGRPPKAEPGADAGPAAERSGAALIVSKSAGHYDSAFTQKTFHACNEARPRSPRSVREGDRCSLSSSFLPPLGYEPYGMRLLRLCQSLCRGLTSGGSTLTPPTGMSRTSSVRRYLATGWLMTCQPFGAFSSHIPSTSTDQMSVGT